MQYKTSNKLPLLHKFWNSASPNFLMNNFLIVASSEF